MRRCDGSKVVFVWARFSEGSDGNYIEVSKAAFLRACPPASGDDREYDADIRDLDPDTLYID